MALALAIGVGDGEVEGEVEGEVGLCTWIFNLFLRLVFFDELMG